MTTSSSATAGWPSRSPWSRSSATTRPAATPPLLAYYGFFSLFPLLLVAVTVTGFILQGRSDLADRIVASAAAQFPTIGADIAKTVQGSHLRGSGLAGVAASAVVNTLLFLVGFRVLTVRNVPLRSLLPGAVLAALAWALLQWLGAWYVGRKLTRATNTYGTFTLVIGLLSWLYLAATVTLYAAELNAVRARRRWPRSLAPPPLGPADEQVLEDLAKQEERRPEQRVEVSFGADEEPAERPAEREPPAQTG